jgi:16S rRNA G966 N2-methylase RsmD
MASISDLKFDHKNARKRTNSSSTLIRESLQRYGAARSIVIDEDNRILAGNGTIEAAKALGLDKLKVIEAAGDEIIAVKRTGLSEHDKVGLALADNRAAELSEWDAEMLHQLSEEHDLEPWFEPEDLEQLLNQTQTLDPVEGNTDPDEVPEPPADPITKPGDLWILGNHRLLCGDSTNIQHVERLMDGQKADMVFTDPPYGISVVGKTGTVGGGGLCKANQYEPIAGDDSIDVALEAIQLINTLSPKVQVIWGGNYYATALPNVASWIVWDKRGDMASNNFADCELAWCSAGSPARIYRQIWSGMIKQGESGKRVHPTQKPVKLAEWCFDQYGKECKTVLDLFCGSGSTLIACEISQKAGYMMELSPAYCDVIVKRWEDFTGNTAVCIPSDAHFTESQEAA